MDKTLMLGGFFGGGGKADARDHTVFQSGGLTKNGVADILVICL
jgi:hypothetical protein